MKNSWIPINKMQIPTSDRSLRVLLYTPDGKDVTMQYRVSDPVLAIKLKDATHWQPCLPPGPEGE